MGTAPCTLHDVHVQCLSPIVKEVRTFCAPRGVQPPKQECTDALTSLLKACEHIDCLRFLLKARNALCSPPEGFDKVYNHYWDAYGGLLGKLISKREQDADVGVICGEIRQAFTSRQDWGVRARVTACFVPLAMSNYVEIADVSKTVFEPFWQTLDYFTAYCRATFENPWKQDRPFLDAITSYCDLSYQLTVNMVSKMPTLREEVLRRLVTLAESTLPLVVWAKPLPNDLCYWRDATSALCARFKPLRGERPAAVQATLDKVANELYKQSRAEKRHQFRAAYDTVLAGLMPLLRGYPQATSRKRIDSSCSLRLTTADAQISVEGFLVNVCDRSYKGFCVETKGVSLVGDSQDGGPLTEVEVRTSRDTPASVKVRGVIVEFQYDIHDPKKRLTSPCGILRAWRLETGDGTGFAVFAAKDALKGLPTGWKRFVDNLPYAGRYQP